MFDITAFIVLFLGASIIAIIGSIANYLTEKDGNKVSLKSVMRDFVIGGILTSVAWVFVPESFTSVEGVIQNVSMPSLPVFSGGSIGDIDIHVGPPSF